MKPWLLLTLALGFCGSAAAESPPSDVAPSPTALDRPTVDAGRPMAPIVVETVAGNGTEPGEGPSFEPPAAGGSSHPPQQAGHGEAPEAAGGDGLWATHRAPQPFDIIRTIQFLQDQVSRGNDRAIRVQAMLLRRFGPVFLEASPAVWSDGRNMRAAVLFVLSGGPPEVLRRLMDGQSLDAGEKPLFEGALAYVQNDLEKAQQILSGIALDDMEPGLAAHLNLVLGQMKQLKHPQDAVRHLDQARLLAPGGLIEEAALRMEVLIAEDLGDHALADHLARQYFDRYFRSSYSLNFEARFASVYAGRGAEDAQAAAATMADVAKRLPDANKRGLFLAVARRSLVEGHLELADLASIDALKIDGLSAAERERATLYAVAAKLGSIGPREAQRQLQAIDRNTLHPEDVKLLDAAASVIEGIDRSPDPAGRAPTEGEQVAESSPVADRAQQVLNEVATDLRKAQQ